MCALPQMPPIPNIITLSIKIFLLLKHILSVEEAEVAA